MSRAAAAVAAARTRLRPILMTSFAFILGVLPLAVAQGAGAEMRQSLGIAVLSGMIGVTFFGLLFTPVFYVISRWLAAILGYGPLATPGGGQHGPAVPVEAQLPEEPPMAEASPAE